jgi:hypothetical protein
MLARHSPAIERAPTSWYNQDPLFKPIEFVKGVEDRTERVAGFGGR